MVEMARELKLTIKGTNNKVKIAEMLRARIIEIETQLRSKKTTDKIYYTFRDQYDN
jgi:capsular polysaccharide biosynthesis protein